MGKSTEEEVMEEKQRVPTREELVEYVAKVIQREGPLSRERQIEVILEGLIACAPEGDQEVAFH